MNKIFKGIKLTGRKPRLLILLVCFVVFMSSCDDDEKSYPGPSYSKQPGDENIPVYRLAVHPLFTPHKLMHMYQPLATYLNLNVRGVNFQLEPSRNYEAYEEKIRFAAPEFLLPNPWQTLKAMDSGYEVIAESGDAEDFKGVFVVRKDSPVSSMADLKGKVISYPAATALAACIMPQYMMHKAGINVMHDIQNKFVGSQESSLMHVFYKQSDVGVTWPPPWRTFQKDHPKKAAELKVIWLTPSLMNNSFMVRNDVPANVREKVRTLLLNLGKSKEGIEVLQSIETAAFHKADNQSYQKVRSFIKKFEREVRPVTGGME